jgi:uncharacterized membrane protein YedE/YeeE
LNKHFLSMLTAILSGLVFGIGLLLAGMANPSKVLAFFDLAGQWDPSLTFVMIGAISVSFFAFRIAAKRNHSYLGQALHIPASRRIDRRLLLGSLVFGAGWALSGICPGTALVALASGNSKGLVFTLAMLAGMAIFEWLNKRSTTATK